MCSRLTKVTPETFHMGQADRRISRITLSFGLVMGCMAIIIVALGSALVVAQLRLNQEKQEGLASYTFLPFKNKSRGYKKVQTTITPSQSTAKVKTEEDLDEDFKACDVNGWETFIWDYISATSALSFAAWVLLGTERYVADRKPQISLWCR